MSDVLAGLAIGVSSVTLVLSWYWRTKTDMRSKEANALAAEANTIAKHALEIQSEQADHVKADRAERILAEVIFNRRERDGRLSLINTGPGTARSVAVRTKQGDILKESGIITSIAPRQTSYASNFERADRRPDENAYFEDRSIPGAAVRILWTNADGTPGDSGWTAARL